MFESANIFYTSSQSPWGNLTLAATESGLCGTWFEGQKYFPETAHWQLAPQHPWLLKAQDCLNDYAQGRGAQLGLAELAARGLPLDVSAGTAFQQSVWAALLHIPYGQTRRYGQLAQAIGKPQAARAVGAAIGRNPISIIIPCHRVLGANGQMTGYAGGIWRKEALLHREAPT